MRRSSGGEESSGQKNADFYDRTFDADDSWRSHYTESPYYFIWTVLLDRLRRSGAKRVLEIACGSGQLATAIRDTALVETYRGFDFSAARLRHAERTCREYEFEVADAFSTDVFERYDYDTAIATEFLEHVEGDLEVLGKLPPGTRFLGTVPNFPFVSHVRCFADVEEVEKRYGPLFDELDIVALAANERGKTFFVIEGLKS